MTTDEVRAAMLKTAVDLIAEHALTVSLDHISLDAIVVEAGVARSAAYRVWEKRDDFIKELLVEVARSSAVQHAAFDLPTLRTATAELERSRGRLDTPDLRRHALVETCRSGAMINFESLGTKTLWQTEVALRTTIMSFAEEQRADLLTVLDDSVRLYVSAMAAFYEGVGAVLGFKMISGRSFMDLAASGSALMEGFLLRALPGIRNREAALTDLAARFDADPFMLGKIDEWTAPAVAFTANLLALVELDPDFVCTGYDANLDRVRKIIDAVEASVEVAQQATDAPPLARR